MLVYSILRRVRLILGPWCFFTITCTTTTRAVEGIVLQSFHHVSLWGDQLRVDLLRRWRVEEETYGWDIIHGNPFFLEPPCTACAFHQSFSWFFPIWCQRNNLHCFLVGNHIPYLCKTANNHHWFIFYYFSRQRQCVFFLDSFCFSLAKINRSEYFELCLITVSRYWTWKWK